MSKEQVYLVFTIENDKQYPPQFYQKVQASITETRKEPGCISYHLVKDLGVHGFLEPRPHAYSLIEHFKSLHDFEEHDKKPYVAELKALGPKYGIHYSARFYQSAI